MINDYTFIDFDGVILDTEQRMLDRKYDLGFHNHHDETEYLAYFDYTKLHPEEWDYIIRKGKSINNSVEIIQELESLKKKIAILTKVHTLYEMKTKIEDLREHRNIECPVFFVPPGVEKYQVIIPNNQLLIDDFEKNVNAWIANGGQGLIFDSSIPKNTGTKIRSLEFLLKR